MIMRPLYIFDLDGTLADINHRRHYVERPAINCSNCAHAHNERFCRMCGTKHPFKSNWDAFHAACIDDTPIAPTIRLLVDLYLSLNTTNTDIWVWSGRMATVRQETIEWIDKHVIALDEPNVSLRMRPVGDYTPDDQLKESWLHALPPEDRKRLVMVFDDRDRVVSMWRRNGIVCAQVAPGDF